jgi:hypothetical protein
MVILYGKLPKPRLIVNAINKTEVKSIIGVIKSFTNLREDCFFRPKSKDIPKAKAISFGTELPAMLIVFQFSKTNENE